MDYIKFKSYTGKFIFSYVFAYIIIAVIYLFMQSRIEAFSSPALEFFQPYRPLSFKVILAQIILGFILAIVIYPLYKNINQNKNRILIIFGLIWGLGLIGSLNPMPGSFEGLIYTEVTVFEHLVVLGLTALQIITFIWLFITWSNKSHNFVSQDNNSFSSERFNKSIIIKPLGYLFRFILLYVIVYTGAGILFYFLQDYETAFASMEYFQFFRPLDHQLVRMAPFLQLLRGGLLAAFIYPIFYLFLARDRGWILFFVVFFGLTVTGSSYFAFELVEDLFSGDLASNAVGLLEVVTQVLIFTWLFFKWMGKGKAVVLK